MHERIATGRDADVGSLRVIFAVIIVCVCVRVLKVPCADFTGGFKDLKDKVFQVSLITILTYHTMYCMLEEIFVTVIIPSVHAGYKQL